MKFTVNSKDMKAAVATASKAIQGKSTLPILSCVKIDKTGDDHLLITGGDAEVMLTLRCPLIESHDFHPICLEAAQLNQILGSVGSQPVTFDVSGNSVTFIYKNGHLTFASQNVEDFPIVEDNIEAVDSVEIPTDKMLNGMSICRPFINHDELRPITNGVYLDMTGEYLTMAATDIHKMVRLEMPEIKTKGKVGCVISEKTASLLTLLPKGETLAIRANGRQALFASETFFMMSTGIEGRFPNYNSVIPRDYTCKATINRAELISIIKRVSLMGNAATNLIELRFGSYMGGDGQITVRTRCLDFATSGEEVMSAEHDLPDNFTIGFKSTCLLDLLNTHTTKEVTFELKDASRAGVMHDTEGGNENLLTLLMPMMLDY